VGTVLLNLLRYPKATHHPVPLLATMEAGDGDGNQLASAPAGAGHGGGCARAPTWCSALVAGRWPTG
jgi:hypothetical protein